MSKRFQVISKDNNVVLVEFTTLKALEAWAAMNLWCSGGREWSMKYSGERVAIRKA